MRKPKIFISHSTKNDENLAFLEKLYQSLKLDEAGNAVFDVLVDRKKLRAGDKWHYKITEWMHECDAAVILLNKDALESDWVKAESTVVAVRDRIEPDFKMVPVLLDGVTPECVSKHQFLGSGSAAQLNETQFINEIDEDTLIATIKDVLSDLQAHKAPFERIGEVISRILQEVNEDTLADAWEHLEGTHKPTWKQGSEPFAEALMRYLFRQHEHCLQRFQDILDQIRPKMNPLHAKEFLEYIRALWVDPAASACLPATAQQKNKMAVMNGEHLQNFTFKRYIERAWPLSDKFEYVPISQINDLDTIQEQMRDHFQFSEVVRLEPEECDEEINDSNNPVLVCLPSSESEGGLLDYRTRHELKTLYPGVIFVMATGERLPETYPEDILGVEPALELKVERRQMIAEGKAAYYLKKYCGND